MIVRPIGVCVGDWILKSSHPSFPRLDHFFHSPQLEIADRGKSFPPTSRPINRSTKQPVSQPASVVQGRFISRDTSLHNVWCLISDATALHSDNGRSHHRGDCTDIVTHSYLGTKTSQTAPTTTASTTTTLHPAHRSSRRIASLLRHNGRI